MHFNISPVIANARHSHSRHCERPPHSVIANAVKRPRKKQRACMKELDCHAVCDGSQGRVKNWVRPANRAYARARHPHPVTASDHRSRGSPEETKRVIA
jgi:hypothetical protein